MAVSTTKSKPNRARRRRRWPWLLGGLSVLLVLLPVGLVLAAPSIANSEAVRSRVIDIIAKTLGMPAEVEGIRLSVYPELDIVAEGVHLGDGDFQATADSIHITGSLGDLLRQHVNIGLIDIQALHIQMPEELGDGRDRISTLVEYVKDDSDDEQKWQVTINRLAMDNAHIQLGAGDERVLSVSAELLDVVSQELGLTLDAAAPHLGPNANAEFDVLFLIQPDGPMSIRGGGSIAGVHLDKLPIEGAPEGILQAEFAMVSEDVGVWGMDVRGELESDQHPALAGDFELTAWWEGETATLNEARWDAPGLSILANASRHADGELAVHINRANITDAALDSLVDMGRFGDVSLTATDEANVRGSDIVAGKLPDGTLRFVRGNVDVAGLDLALDTGEALTKNLKFAVTLEDDHIVVQRCTADGLHVTGRLRPHPADEQLTVDLQGSVQLKPEYLEMAGVDGIDVFSGTVALSRIAGTFGGEKIVSDDLSVIGAWENGEIRLISGETEERLSDINLTFQSDIDGVVTELRAESLRAGAVEITGRYDFDVRRWEGHTQTDIAKIVRSFVETESDSPLNSLLAEFTPAPVTIAVQMPTEQSKEIEVHLRRAAAPPIDATVTLSEREDAWGLNTLEAFGSLPVARVATEVLGDTSVPGDALWTFKRDPVTSAYSAVVDLSQPDIQIGPRLHKRPGDTFTATLAGAAGDTWDLQTIHVRLLDSEVPFVFEDGCVRLESQEFQLSDYNELFSEDSRLTGRSIVTFASEPFKVDATFDNVSLNVESGARLDRLDGRVLYEDGRLSVDDFRMQLDESECVLNAAQTANGWEGELSGSLLDINAIEKLFETIRAAARKESESITETPPEPIIMREEPFRGRFTVALDELRYRRATFTNVDMVVQADENGIRVRDIHLTPYTGSITGRIDIVPGVENHAMLQLTLAMNQAESRFLDELVYAESKRLYGLVDAALQFQAPLYNSAKAVLARGDGVLNIAGDDGSLGEFGIATDVLRVLRTTQLISLKAPELSEKGLVYDTLKADFSMRNGVMEIDEFTVDGGAYAVLAQGDVSFAQDNMDVLVLARILEGVGSIVEKIPLLGSAVKKLTTDIVGVYVGAQGSPYDPEVSVAKETGINTIKGLLGAIGDAISLEEND